MKNRFVTFFQVMALALAILVAPAAVTAEAAKPSTSHGVASYYHTKFQGRKTANGERYDHGAMTAAHRTLPFGTKVRVTNVKNGRSVVVRINDRGPFVKKRVIDVSGAAARKLGLLQSGTGRVKIEVLSNRA